MGATKDKAAGPGRGHGGQVAAHGEASSNAASIAGALISSATAAANAFPSYARPLIANGFLVTPIKAGEKRPVRARWERERFTAADAGRFPGCGIGVLCGQGEHPIAAIDIDTTRADLATRFTEWCESTLGMTCARVGAAPKILLVYRAAVPGLRKATGAWFADDSGGKHRVEVLGDGQQFVAYHVHPDTGVPYQWVDLLGGIEAVHASELPVITAEQIAQALEQFARFALDAGLTTRASAAPSSPQRATDLDDPLMAYEPAVGITLDSARHLLTHADATDYDEWLRAGMSLHHEFSGSDEALDVWDAWSTDAANYAGREDIEKRWQSFGHRTDRPVTVKWLLARDKTQPAAVHAPEVFESVHKVTDSANAARLARHYREDLAYTPAGWCTFVGTHWERSDEAAMRCAMNLSRLIAGEVAKLSEQAKRTNSETERDRLLELAESLAKFGRRSEDIGKIQAALGLARNLLKREASLFDADPWLLNCPNGTVDLRTGVLRAHRREDYITRIAPVAFDAKAPRATWESVLAAIVPDDTIRAFLKRLLGYGLTGVTTEQVMAIFWGCGANGKSTLLDTIKAALGPYMKAAPPRLLENTKTERHPTEIADLWNARLVVASETEDGTRLREAFIKSVTGDDKLKARFMHRDFFEFTPTHKLVLSTNHKPVVTGTDHAIWRRLLLIPFQTIFGTPAEVAAGRAHQVKNTTLLAQLKRELPGILAWMVEGCLEWQRAGLAPPPAVQQATDTYREEMDKLADFLRECCEVGDNKRVAATPLYNEYATWCKANGYGVESQRGFGLRMKERGFAKKHSATGWEYLSVALRGLGRDF